MPYDIICNVPYDIIRNVNTDQNEEWYFKPGCISGVYRKPLFEKTLYGYRIYVRCFDKRVKRKILQDFIYLLRFIMRLLMVEKIS